MLVLHHNDMSSCSQKVRFVLEEKGIAWSSEELNLRLGEQFNKEYTALNPKAVVPTLVEGEMVITESAVIAQYLDERFPGRSLTPSDPLGRARLRLWIHPIDEYLHNDISIMSNAMVFADEIRAANDTEEKLERYLASIPDPQKRALRRELVTEGTNAGVFRIALWRYKKFFGRISATLSSSPFLLGDVMTLADVVCLPYIIRFQHLNQGHLLRDLPGIENWHHRMCDTDGYRKGIEKWFKQKGIDNMMAAGAAKGGEIEKIWNQDAI